MSKMRLKNIIFKVASSIFIAFVFLNIFCFFYSNVPAHYESNSGATDFVRVPNQFFSRWSEGGNWGWTNNEGLYNLYDYQEHMSIDILTMGSSNTEGACVPMDKAYPSILNSLFLDKTVYNLGMPGHNFLTCIKNLDAAIAKYQPKESIIILADTLSFSVSELEASINKQTPEIQSYTSGIMNMIERIPYMRLLYDNWNIAIRKKLSNMSQFSQKIVSTENTSTENTEKLLDSLLSSLGEKAINNNIDLIIVYHPSIEISDDASLIVGRNEGFSQLFGSLCAQYGIKFVDMQESFVAKYNSEHVLPHGFANSSIGKGHLNQHGHAMIAEALFKLIEEGE